MRKGPAHRVFYSLARSSSVSRKLCFFYLSFASRRFSFLDAGGEKRCCLSFLPLQYCLAAYTMPPVYASSISCTKVVSIVVGIVVLVRYFFILVYCFLC